MFYSSLTIHALVRALSDISKIPQIFVKSAMLVVSLALVSRFPAAHAAWAFSCITVNVLQPAQMEHTQMSQLETAILVIQTVQFAPQTQLSVRNALLVSIFIFLDWVARAIALEVTILILQPEREYAWLTSARRTAHQETAPELEGISVKWSVLGRILLQFRLLESAIWIQAVIKFLCKQETKH